ncbi:MAG: thiamine-phosphate kinase [Methanomassiliicoccales archaeon]|jgi:thiamine-monophosphate kinase
MSTLGDMGEKEVVWRILGGIRSSAPVGPGDDAAAVDMGDYYLVVTTDLISLHTHIPKIMTDRQIGWMLAAVNYSDIAAMGARPIGMVVSLALPRETAFSSLESMMDGMQDCSESVGAEILGGDTKESPEMTLAGTALGTVKKNEILLRKGSRPGDYLAVTGTLGLAAAGYYALVKGLHCPSGVKALLEPKPRVKEGLLLSSSGAVTSCMDISDGLASSVYQLSEMSGVSFSVDWDSIPVKKEVLRVAEDCGMNPEELALYCGGDYQLLFTVAPDKMPKLRSPMRSRMSIIGKANKPGRNTLKRGGRVGILENRGYEHFR